MLPDDYDLSDEEMEQIARDTLALNETSAGWFQRYGFNHECRCDMDYAEGDVETVPKCLLGAMDDAFNMCAFYRGAITSIAAGTIEDPQGFAEALLSRDHLAEFKAGAVDGGE